MLFVSLLFAISNANPTPTGLVAMPADLILPIVSHLSYQELVALNRTNKSFYAIARPIFEFESACQVVDVKVWKDSKLQIVTDKITDFSRCAVHLMHYAALYKDISIDGNPANTAALFGQITAPLHSSIDVVFRKRSLNQTTLAAVIQSISVGSIFLNLSRQKITRELMALLTSVIQLPSNPFNGLFFDMSVLQPPTPNLFTSFFNALPSSNLDRITISGSLEAGAFLHLADALPFSKLSTFGMYHGSASVAEFEALGTALSATPTMKKVNFGLVRGSNAMLGALAVDLPTSSIEVLEVMYDVDMDTSILSITALPPNMKILDLSGNSLKPSTVVQVIEVASNSNLKELNFFGSVIKLKNLSADDAREIVDTVVGGHYMEVNLGRNDLDVGAKAILETGGSRIKL